jgi:hypothetical protein
VNVAFIDLIFFIPSYSALLKQSTSVSILDSKDIWTSPSCLKNAGELGCARRAISSPGNSSLCQAQKCCSAYTWLSHLKNPGEQFKITPILLWNMS